MGWLKYRLGNGIEGIIDGDNPNNPPQVSQGAAGTTPWPVVVVASQPITQSNLFLVNASTTPVLLIAANTSRKVITIFNNSLSTLYIKFNSGVTTSQFNFKLTAGAFWESEFYAWSGEIWGVWDATNGMALTTELI